MKFRLHPILLPLFIVLIVTGGISMYAIVFFSLLFHELGHLIAAKRMGMPIKSCTIMPYGGEIIFVNHNAATRKERVTVALGGPIATVLILLLALVIKFPGVELVVNVQLALLFLNLLPILPLDGGRAMSALLENRESPYAMRSYFLIHSIAFLVVAIIVLLTELPGTLSYILLAVFLLIQNIIVFRFRKYERAFLELKIKRLT